jgi:hypothetical protein
LEARPVYGYRAVLAADAAYSSHNQRYSKQR